MSSFFTPWYTRLAVETLIFSVPAYFLITYPNFLQYPFQRKQRQRRRLNYEQSEIEFDLDKGSIDEAKSFYSKYYKKIDY